MHQLPSIVTILLHAQLLLLCVAIFVVGARVKSVSLGDLEDNNFLFAKCV